MTSQDVPEQLIPKNDNNCAGIPLTLKLAVGAQVMLRRNIMCRDGLVNGTRGVIVGFKWLDGADHQAQPGLLPSAVLVKFHDPRVGRIHSIPVPGYDSEAVEIRPISAKFFAQQGTNSVTFSTLLGCHYSQSPGPVTGCSSDRLRTQHV